MQNEDKTIGYFTNPSFAKLKYPNGCCLTASNLLYLYLREKYDITTLKLGFGNSTEEEIFGFEHYWLEWENKYYLDITADQFTKNKKDSVIFDEIETNIFYQRFSYNRGNKTLSPDKLEDLLKKVKCKIKELMKEEFILTEIWSLSISAAFQRANVYTNSIDENLRNDFKKNLRKHIEIIAEQYQNTVDEAKHLANIKLVAECKNDCLSNRELNFGVSQKLLNLYLKYLWCLDKIPTPPHFPVDRLIQEKLKVTKVISWTKGMDDDTDYLKIIAKAKIKADLEGLSIAEWELKNFKRRSEETITK